MMLRIPSASIAALSLALTNCAAPQGTDVRPSLAPHPGAGAPLSAIDPQGGEGQVIDVGATTPRRWWEQFQCPALDVLVTSGLGSSEDIKAADAALTQARELARAAGSALGPQVDASYQVQQARTSASLAPPVTDSNQLLYSLHTAQLTVTYPIDVFGGLHARHRSAVATMEGQRYRLLAARQTLVANLVNAVITRASLVEQINATNQEIVANKEILDLIERRQLLGAAGKADVATQQAALAGVEAGLPSLMRSEAHQRALISVYLGLAPGNDLPPLPSFDCLHLPAHLPVSYPADVVRNRPDVMALTAQVTAAAADLGAAFSARFPAFALTANAGGTSQNFSQMFANGNPLWSIIGGITVPIFHSGALRHQQRAASAALEVAKAQYRAGVLQAFVDVSDALTGLQTDAEALSASTMSVNASETSYTFARRQLELGDIGSFSLLAAETARQQARLQFIISRAARLSDTVALFQANGATI